MLSHIGLSYQTSIAFSLTTLRSIALGQHPHCWKTPQAIAAKNPPYLQTLLSLRFLLQELESVGMVHHGERIHVGVVD